MMRRAIVGILLSRFLFSLAYAREDAGTPKENKCNQVSFSIPILDWAGYIMTQHPKLMEDGQADVGSFFAFGLRVAYARSFFGYFELEPAIEFLLPLDLGWPDNPFEARFLISTRGFLPLAGGVFDLAFECEGGPVVSRLMEMTSLSFALSAYLTGRIWIRQKYGVFLGLGTGYLFKLTGESGTPQGYASSDKYFQSEWQFIRLRLGVAIRF